MGRPVQYFGVFNILLRMWRFNQLSPGISSARRIFITFSKYLLDLAPFLACFILLTMSYTSDKPLKFTSKYIVPVLLLVLNLSNVASLIAKLEKINSLINLVPSVSTRRVRAQLKG